MAGVTKGMISSVKFDFTNFFAHWKTQIIASYRRLLTIKEGVSGDKAPSNAPSVVARKGKDHWMKDTGELYNNGFESKHDKQTLQIFASKKPHSGRYTYKGVPGGHKGQSPYVRRARTETRIKQSKGPHPTYEQIFMWHNQRGYSGIFGKLAKNSKFPRAFTKEAFRQCKDQLPKNIRIKIEGKL